MKKRVFLLLAAALFLFVNIYGEEKELVLHSPTGDIYGTLLMPDQGTKSDRVVLLICGSGPTDRDGNNPQLKGNSIKYLAEALCAAGIPSVRYDKRGIAASQKAGASEADLRFTTYVDDAEGWIDLLSKDYKKIIVAGHSEGATIGTLATIARPKVSALVLIAGPARPADEILKNQMADQPQMVKDMIFPMIDTLKKGETIDNVSPMLYSLFRPSVQPYMISWFAVNPAQSLSQVKVPTLIIQGDKDIQVAVEEAELLHQAQPKAQKEIIPTMNHVFKPCETTDKMAQMAVYGNSSIKNCPVFDEAVTRFVQSVK